MGAGTLAGAPGQVYETLAGSGPGTAVSVILKLRGETCDIDCLYCYEKRKGSPGTARITPDQVRRLPDIFPGRPIAVELHGGEPLTVGKAAMREVLAELAALPSVARVSLQTNGVRLDESWLDLFDDAYPSLRIGLSLDGDPDGNGWRVGYDGRPTYERVADTLALLSERGRAVGVIAAVTPAVLGRAEAVLEHLVGFDAVVSVSFVPCFDATVRRPTASPGRAVPASRRLQLVAVSDAVPPAWSTTPDEYAEFVLASATWWVTSGAHRRVKLEPVVSTIRRLRGLDSGFCHFSGLKCDHVFTAYPDGRFGSCDELPWPAAQHGHLDDFGGEASVTAAQTASELLGQGRALTTRCVTCDYRATCAGGCIATRWRLAREGDEDAYCRYRMRLVDGVAALVAQPYAAWSVHCRQLVARPRTPNAMADVVGFLARWDDPGAPRPVARLATSPLGNVNSVGAAGVHHADDLDPRHPQWRQGIEPGVWALVDVLTTSWGLVTYDSCEGHADVEQGPRRTARRVGILPRDADEYERVAAALCDVATAATSSLGGAVRLTIGRADLTCEASGRRWPVLDLALLPTSDGTWPEYVGQVDDATTALAAALSKRRPAEVAAPCGCHRKGGGS